MSTLELVPSFVPAFAADPLELVTSKGDKFISTISDQQAIELCAKISNSFAKSLVAQSRRGLSPSQNVWAHKLAMDSLNPTAVPAVPANAVNLEDVSAIYLMLTNARNAKLKNPCIRLRLDTTEIMIKFAPSHGVNAGSLYVKEKGEGGVYFGKTNASGVLFTRIM